MTIKQLLRERINEQFEILNEESGQPEAMIPYKIVDEAGKLLASGYTDHSGRTARVSTPGVRNIRLILDE